MSQISVSDLTFCYEGSFDNIFENVSFSIDTDWKLGFVGRNGKGKTTFLKLLQGEMEYRGTISASTAFDYFPYQVDERRQRACWGEILEEIRPDCELWRVICELDRLQAPAEVLYRPFYTLSYGERTKVMLAILFSRDNYFLLIDEPTNHLDAKARELVKAYLRSKKGFILVSHDRDLLDACVDHVLALNRRTIEVQSGNFSTWWENRERRDAFCRAENEKHQKEIKALGRAAERAQRWAEANERSKIGFDPAREHDRGNGTRPYIGAKTKKMQRRVKNLQTRIDSEIVQKEGLLQDVENPAELKLMPLSFRREVLVRARDYTLAYENGDGSCHIVFDKLCFELRRGERVFLNGSNGCGKSSLLKAILAQQEQKNGDVVAGYERKERNRAETDGENMWRGEMDRTNAWHGKTDRADEWRGKTDCAGIRENGLLEIPSGLRISYVSQDTSFLHGDIGSFCAQQRLEESLFKAVLRQLDMERAQFAKNMEDFSEGQKKKVLLAASLLQQAHLYIWDEPLNYIDVFTRMQIEELILKFAPTMLIVEHDVRFRERIATKIVDL